MSKSNDFPEESENLNKADLLLDEEWEDEERTSQVTLNVNVPHHPQTPSQFDKLKEKLPSKKQAAIGGSVAALLGILLEIARQMGWFN